MTPHYVAIDELMIALDCSRAYVYKLAHMHRWRRIRVGRSVRYHWHDVEESRWRESSV
jgi:hypothetical protein